MSKKNNMYYCADSYELSNEVIVKVFPIFLSPVFLSPVNIYVKLLCRKT